ncbi:MAG: carboxypeptidase regulatory-like domain-containing protein [Deltaproteobacteria bacterium]|nr:carboxypeptidase regulatory-like domain-containing protein [Deltaproteobacteria bacterium]
MAQENRENGESEESGDIPEPSPSAARRPLSRRKTAAWGLSLALLAAIGLMVAVSWPLGAPPPGSPGGDGGTHAAAPAPATGTGSLDVEVIDEGGEPIVGARLTLRIRPVAGADLPDLPSPPGAADIILRGVTDDAGHAHFENLPPGRGSLLARAEGRARGHLRVSLQETEDEAEDEAGSATPRVQVALGPALRLEGRVLDETGAPVPGAEVEVRPGAREDIGDISAWAGDGEDDPPWTTHSDEAGDFAFDDLIEGAQTVTVSADGFDRIARRVSPRRGSDGEPLRIVLRRTAVIMGHVSGSDGEGAAGAQVVLAGSGVWPPRSTETDSDGAYRFSGVPEGIYEVRAGRGDEVAAPREGLLLAPGDQALVNLALEAGATLEGLVVAEGSGAPIPDAEVIIGEDALSFAPRAVKTAADGSFRIGGLRPLPHRVNVFAEAYVSAGEAMHVPGGAPLRLVLEPAATVSGRVVDALGHPVVGAVIEVVGTTRSGAPVAVTAGDASFQAAHAHALEEGPGSVGEGGELGVTLGAVPLIPLTPTAAAPRPPPPSVPILGGSGNADDPDDPVSSGPAVAMFVTDETGAFQVSGLPAGRYEVVGRHPDHAPGVSDPFALAPGQEVTEIQVELPAGAAVDGRVVDRRGFPIADVRVEMHCERERFPRWALAAADGTFVFTGALDRCVFSAYPAELPAARVSLVAIGGEVLPVELALEDEVVTLYARIVDDAEFPVAGARLTLRSLRPDAPARRTAFSNDDGTVTIGGLPAPPWRVLVDQEGFAIESVDIRSRESGGAGGGPPGATEEHQVALRPSASIIGRIVDGWDDRPLAGAPVEVRRGDGTRLGEDVTDDEGIFELSRVPVGNYILHAEFPGLLPHDRRVRLVPRRPSIEDLDLEDIALSPGGSVRGDVVDGLGAPVAGAEVAAAAAGSRPAWDESVRTDAAGSFVIAGLAPGETTLWARHPGAGASNAATVRVRPREESPAPTVRLPERFDAERSATGEGATRQHTGVAVRLRDARGRVLIAAVLPQTYAEGMGLRPRDVLLTVDGEAVSSAAQGQTLLRGPPGTEALVEVRRRRDTLLLAITREAYQD